MEVFFRLRCLSRGSSNLSLLKNTGFDGFLITAQHAGTHWIVWMLSHAIAHHYGVAPPQYVNEVSANPLAGHPRHPRPHAALPRIANTHSIPPYALQWQWLRDMRKPPPYAVVIRDVRDLLISHYEKWRSIYAVPFSEYVAGDPRGRKFRCDVWWYIRFANRWGGMAQRHPLETLVLRYEDFRKNPLDHLQLICRHFGLPLTEADLAAGLAVGSKETMALHQDPNVTEKPVRPDGQGDTCFSQNDLAVLGGILHRHLRHDFGYPYFAAPRGFQAAHPPSHAAPAPRPVWQSQPGRAAIRG